MKQLADSSLDATHAQKRVRQVQRNIKHKQDLALGSLQGLQDESGPQSQLLRAISLALSAYGFDEADPITLEAFRASVEEYMLQFLVVVRHSMTASRRQIPIPSDFIHALVASKTTPSSLMPFLAQTSLPSITQPPVTMLPPEPPMLSSLDTLLGGTLTSDNKWDKYVPAHLPKLPSSHTFKHTHIVPAREHDARKIRERATQEGVMAEQALRRLMSASNLSTDSHISSIPRTFTSGKAKSAWEKALGTAQQLDEVEQSNLGHMDIDVDADDIDMDDMGFSLPIASSKLISDTSLESGLAVNYDRRYWRASSRSKT